MKLFNQLTSNNSIKNTSDKSKLKSFYYYGFKVKKQKSSRDMEEESDMEIAMTDIDYYDDHKFESPTPNEFEKSPV